MRYEILHDHDYEHKTTIPFQISDTYENNPILQIHQAYSLWHNAINVHEMQYVQYV
jgi:hypothetical protein